MVENMKISPSYVEVDRKREFRVINDTTGFWSQEELTSDPNQLEKYIQSN